MSLFYGRSFDGNTSSEKAFRFKVGKGKVIKVRSGSLLDVWVVLWLTLCILSCSGRAGTKGWWECLKEEEVIGDPFISGLWSTGTPVGKKWEKGAL